MTTLPDLTDAALLAAIDAADPVPAAVLDTARAALSLADWRALTVRQPWASAIVGIPGEDGDGPKRRENRNRKTNRRGPILIHAGLGYDHEAWMYNRALFEWLQSTGMALSRQKMPHGAIVGTAVIDGCHLDDDCCRPWGEPGAWHWSLTDVRALPEPIPAKGMLGLWRPSPDVVAQALEQLAVSDA
jgi:hypothetical protein